MLGFCCAVQQMWSYITGDARGALGSLEGDVLHGEFVSLSPQSVPGLSVLYLQRKKSYLYWNNAYNIWKEHAYDHCMLLSTSLKLAALIFACVISGLSDVIV